MALVAAADALMRGAATRVVPKKQPCVTVTTVNHNHHVRAAHRWRPDWRWRFEGIIEKDGVRTFMVTNLIFVSRSASAPKNVDDTTHSVFLLLIINRCQRNSMVRNRLSEE